MKARLFLLTLAAFLILAPIASGQEQGSVVTDVILSGYTARKLTTEPVPESKIDLILKCGIKAPSARNGQPWKFTVIKDNALISEVIPNSTPGNIIIIVSGLESSQGASADFDCALATENMFIAAQGLGLGAHIYTGPVGKINSSQKQALSIPEGYRVISVLRIGNIDKSVDAVSSASSRKKAEDVINYK